MLIPPGAPGHRTKKGAAMNIEGIITWHAVVVSDNERAALTALLAGVMGSGWRPRRRVQALRDGERDGAGAVRGKAAFFSTNVFLKKFPGEPASDQQWGAE